MAGFLKIESGSILLDGVDISKKPIEKRDIAILFQHNNLFEHLNIQDNITIGNKKKIDLGSILKELGLEGYEKKYPHQLSGGEQQRVALARTLLRGDKILLLDEPFSALDRKTRLRMLSLIAKITKEKNLYTIFITHNKEDSDLIANKLYIMRDFCLEEN
jgi:ABC-type Fe3+/spermidine/putrescine transport system ATPase subunit